MTRRLQRAMLVVVGFGAAVSVTCNRSNTAPTSSSVSSTVLSVVLTVTNAKFGSAVPSDFTVVVSGPPTSLQMQAADNGAVGLSIPMGLTYEASVTGPAGYDVARSAGCSGTADGSRQNCQIALTEQPMTCHASLWTPVYHQDRLRVLDSCQTASGVVADIGLEADGDLVMELIPDPPYAGLLRPGNRSNPNAHGRLIVEVPCQAPTTEAAPRAACAAFTGSKIQPPVLGAHIVAAAHWVEDLNHSSWGELHGARILVLPR